MLDPIADMLTRIRNAQQAGHSEVLIPFSKLKMAILNIFQKNRFIASAKQEKDENSGFPVIKVILKYNQVGNKKVPVIHSLKRISKEGQRIYIKKDDIHKIKNGLGFTIISTSQGVLTSDEAKKKGLGGEVICEIW